MTLPVFAPPSNPHAGSKSKPEFKVLKADFGEGYTQMTGTMNSVRDVETLTWEKIKDGDADQIEAFIRERKGCQTFLYAIPGRPEGKWTCDDFERVRFEAGRSTVTATFRQNFSLSA